MCEISLVWSAAHYRGCALNTNYHLTLQVPQRHPVPQQPPLLLHGGEQGQADPGGARPGAHQEAAAQLWPVGCVVFMSYVNDDDSITVSPLQPRPPPAPPLLLAPAAPVPAAILRCPGPGCWRPRVPGPRPRRTAPVIHRLQTGGGGGVGGQVGGVHIYCI